jgi:hypothetical protein
MKDEIELKIRALAIYQLLGGIRGLWVAMFSLGIKAQTSWLLLIMAPVFYGYSIFCGVTLFTNEQKGLKHSKINQLLQIVSFMAFGFGFQYVSGAFLSLGIDWTDALILKFNLGLSAFYLGADPENSNLLLNINLVAIFLVVFIDRIRTQLKKYSEKHFSFEKKEAELNS